MTVSEVKVIVDDFLLRKRSEGYNDLTFHVFGDEFSCNVANEDLTDILTVPSDSFDFSLLISFLEDHSFLGNNRHYEFLEVA